LDSNIATISLTVNNTNTAPTAAAQSLTTAEDTAKAIVLSATDPDAGQTLTYTVVAAPTHGTMTGTAPNLTYTPAANYSGPDSFTFTARDWLVTSNAATVTITVTPVNDPPVAAGQGVTTAEDTTRAVTLSATDVEGDALTYAVASAPAHGTLSGTAPNLTYRPATNYNGPDSFTFTAGDGQAISAAATVSITVTPVNDMPVATDDAYSMSEDTTLSIPAPGVLGNDTDIESAVLTTRVLESTVNGTLTLNANGSFVYVPRANFSGLDVFYYYAVDGQGASTYATVVITVTAVNDLPVAAPQSVTTAEDTALGLTLAASDVDGGSLTYAVASQPAHGTLSGAAPNLTYTPAANYNGPDSFTFIASDGVANSAPATVSITVTPVNDAPVANAGPDMAGTVGQTLSFSGAASTDVDGTIVSYSWNWGDGTANGTGVSATHAYATAGTKTITLSVTDNAAGAATDTLVVTVSAVNLALSKPASASSTRSGSSYTAAKAVDGTTTTSWMSDKTSGDQWVKVDLGSSKSISNIKVQWPATYYAKSFKVETSTNGTSWTQRYSTTSGTGGVTNVTFTAASARYVRVTCTKPNNSSYYGVAELEVYP